MGISSTLLACINCITLCVSLPFVIVGFIIKHNSHSPCDPIMYKPLLVLGFGLMIISLLGMIGGCCRITIFLWLYAIALFFLAIFLLVSLIIGGVILNGKDKAENSKDFHLTGVSGWLKRKMMGSKDWEEFQQCMIENDACFKMNGFRSVLNFLTMKKAKLSTIESGCCQPPEECGFELKSETEWKIPDKIDDSKSPDCKTFSNNQKKLCYTCESCKAGYLDMFFQAWRKLTILNGVLLGIVLLVFILSICALP